MADIISRLYGGFRGVDFRGEEINLMRSPDSLNVWKDYKETESIRTRPDLEFFTGGGEEIFGFTFFRGSLFYVCGANLWEYSLKNKTNRVLRWGVGALPCNFFVFEDCLYFINELLYLKYDLNVEVNNGVVEPLEVKNVEGYVPTTSIGRKPNFSGGTMYQDVNMLSPYRINTFLSDGKSKEYFLDATNIDTDFVPEVKIEGQVIPTFTVDYEKGKITFNTAIGGPLTDGQDNVTIKFKKTVQGYKESILNCTLLQVFDNRVFFSGNKDYPNTVWHCSLNDPSYISDTDYYREGTEEAKVTGIVAGNNNLWVFKEPSDTNTTVFYHTPTIDEEGNKVYPSVHSSVTTGCVGKAINFNDDIVFFSNRGMEGISGDVTTEQVIGHRSTLVDRKLTAEPKYKDMILEEWNGYLLAFIGNKVYLADSRSAFTNENHIEYEWFYWELDKEITCAKVYDGVLYLGTNEGIYTLTNTTNDVESYWVTPKDKFDFPHKLKTTNKRGCVVEATGDISVYAKLEDTDFELIGEYTDITDYFVSRIKRKKFKDIQLKFHSNKRFSLETVTLECFVGGYIKR